MYNILLKEYKEKPYDLGIQKNELTKADEDYHIVAKTVLNIARKAEEIFESSEVAEKNQFMKFLLQNPIVDGKKPVFAMREPFSSIAKASGHPTLLRLEAKLATVHLGKNINATFRWCLCVTSAPAGSKACHRSPR